ncbi:ARM repeat superfamily protein [Euphorbia peplus]|nr:ARM repeat superfamily protein [Euphorbia peplus]
MAKKKGPTKKPQKRGVDFKKIKRKLGRKLPPPKNATNTEIKSKAIILPEQSVAADKSGLALSKKGLTLKELLQQTSHYSPKVRKDGLLGMKDLFANHPEELNSHRYQVIEKLRERISDDDKMVRETLYQLFKSVILPGCKEDDQGLFISLMMVYIFNAMTHLAIEVRLMAFRFFDLVVQQYPPVFAMYSEKILHNYGEILRKNQFYLEDKGKLKNVLAGLIQCLSLLPSKKIEVDSFEKNVPQLRVLHAFEPDVTESTEFAVTINKLKDFLPILVDCFQDFIPLIHSLPMLDGQSFDCMVSILQSIDLVVRYFVSGTDKVNPDSHSAMWDQVISSVLVKKLFAKFPYNPVHHLSVKDSEKYFTLNIRIAEIFFHLNERLHPAADLLDKFLAFLEYALLGKICSDTRSGKAVREKQILTLVPFIPKLIAQLIGPWRSRVLEAFTKTFLEFNPESPVKLACLSGIEEMLFSGEGMLYPNECDSELCSHQITWMRELPLLLILLGERHSFSSQILLHLLLRLGQSSIMNSFLALEYDKIQHSLQKFYSSYEEGNLRYGPFIKLSRDCQELAICCLYYFSHLDSSLLKSIVSCCLCHELDPFILFRMVEVLHSSYKAGHIDISDHISFFITLASGFKVPPSTEDDTELLNLGTFKSLSNILCTYLSEMGDTSLVFLILEKVIMEQILLKPNVDNACAMLRMLVTLDSNPTKLSEQSIIVLSNFLAEYLIDIMHCVPENKATGSIAFRQQRYYALPCFFLFGRSLNLQNLVLKAMGSLSSGNNNRSTTSQLRRVNAIVSVLLMMHNDSKMKQCLSSSREELDRISQRILTLQTSDESNLSVGEKHRIQAALDQLKTI